MSALALCAQSAFDAPKQTIARATGRYNNRVVPTTARLVDASEAPFEPKTASNPAQRQGQLYEAWVQERLALQFGLQHLQGPWLLYTTAHLVGWAQIDALIFDLSAGRIYIVEVKKRHTREAYKQLFNLYRPVLQKALGARGLFTLICVEITNNFDESESRWIDATTTIQNELHEAQPAHLNVLIWRQPKPWN